MKNKRVKKTLWLSVITSSPGPLAVGLGLLISQSSTQVADFVRRSIELLALILSLVIYSITTRGDIEDLDRKARYERRANLFISISMMVSGIIMLILVLFSDSEDKGNVIPGLLIALSGVISNSIFWGVYQKLGKESQNNILKAQSKLYRSKTLVDTSVVAVLSVVLFSSNQEVAHQFDLVGTVCVSLYLLYIGVKSFVTECKGIKPCQ